MTTTIKFVQSDGLTDVFTNELTYYEFYSEETEQMDIRHVQKNNVFLAQNGLYGLTRTGYPYRIFSVKFYLKYKDTLSKLQSLFDANDSGQPYIFKMYYEYSISQTSNAFVRMMLQDMKWNYYSGYAKETIMNIRFVECKPAGVGMLYSPMLQHFGNGS